MGMGSADSTAGRLGAPLRCCATSGEISEIVASSRAIKRWVGFLFFMEELFQQGINRYVIVLSSTSSAISEVP